MLQVLLLSTPVAQFLTFYTYSSSPNEQKKITEILSTIDGAIEN